jgi:chromatin segregation and condensation protein Rec8/ScpA/Scc1 (kleisin family)
MEETNKRLDAIIERIDKAEIRFEKRMDRLEDRIEERMTNIEKDVNAFKKWTMTLFISLHAGAEYIKAKLGL